MKLEILKEKHLRFYEEYDTPQFKHKVQKGAKRGKLTGKAIGFICVDPRRDDADLLYYADRYDAISSYHILGDLRGSCLTFDTASLDYISENCRRIAKSEVPLEWLKNANIYFEED